MGSPNSADAYNPITHLFDDNRSHAAVRQITSVNYFFGATICGTQKYLVSSKTITELSYLF